VGIAVYVENNNENKDGYFPVAGSTELESLWKPIIHENNLYQLDYIVTAGLRIDGDNYLEVLKEIRVMQDIIERQYRKDEEGSPAARCSRLMEIVSTFEPTGPTSIYIG